MALIPGALALLAPLLRNARVLSFGYPDLLMSPDTAAEILGGGPLFNTTPYGAAHKQTMPLADTVEAFASVGATLSCVDTVRSRNSERFADLNYAQNFGDPFDLVLDAGTIEHCANIGQALMNAANAVAVGGHVFHAPPMSVVNHGFYNVCPTLLHDFYTQNGWTVMHLTAYGFKAPHRVYKVEPVTRFQVPDMAGLQCLARRTDARSLQWPTQSKYRAAE